MNMCPETFPIIIGHEPVAADALVDTSDWINLENAKGALIIVSHYRGGDTDVVLTVHEGATGTGTTALTTGAEFPIWVNTDMATSDALVRQTDAVTYTIDTGTYTGTQLVVFYIPAAKLTSGYKWIQLGCSGGHASSIISGLYILDGARYQQETPPTAIS